METDAAHARAVKSGLMVPWGWATRPRGAEAAAEELRKALNREGAKSVRVTTAGDGLRVSASFAAGPFGFIVDEAEFVLATDGTAAFRAASSSAGLFPFSSSEKARDRNRDRLLRVRRRLFDKNGWTCGCPSNANPFAGVRCALFCEP